MYAGGKYSEIVKGIGIKSLEVNAKEDMEEEGDWHFVGND